MIDAIFAMTNIISAVLHVAFGMYDQTHYHIKAVRTHCSIAWLIVVNYFCSIPRHFLAHMQHGEYLHSLGMTGTTSLTDTGSLVWRPFASANKANDSEPVVSVSGIVNNVSGNPAHISLAATALAISWTALERIPSFKYENAIYVDFGCGTGFALLGAMTKPFQKIIGVELHARSASLARLNVDKFLFRAVHRSVPVQCEDVTVETMNMCSFDFRGLYWKYNANALDSDPLPTIVLHVDEPLWNVPKADAHPIYRRVFANVKASKLPVLVAYFYCGIYNGDALPALEEMGAELLYQCDCDSLNFSAADKFFLYKFN